MPEQEQEVARQLNTNEEKPGAQEQEEETHKDTQPQEVEQIEQEVKAKEEELIIQADGQHGQHIPEAPAANQEQAHKVPVHQGQPEIWAQKHTLIYSVLWQQTSRWLAGGSGIHHQFLQTVGNVSKKESVERENLFFQ